MAVAWGSESSIPFEDVGRSHKEKDIDKHEAEGFLRQSETTLSETEKTKKCELVARGFGVGRRSDSERM